MGKDRKRSGSARDTRAPQTWVAITETVADGAGYRIARLERLIFEEVSTVIRDELTDPALDDVEVTNVTLSVDYRHAKITVETGKDIGKTEAALERASGVIRGRLTDALDLKRIPQLRFVAKRREQDHAMQQPRHELEKSEE